MRDLLDLLAAGMTTQEILDDSPDLEAEDVRACLAWAARLARAEGDRSQRVGP